MPRPGSLLLIFGAGFLFAFFLLQNLPFTFGDDLNIIDLAKRTSWLLLFKELFNPLTPAWYVHGEECLLSTRVFGTLLFKFLHALFGYHPNAFHAMKAFAYAGCGSLIFLFVQTLTRRRFLGVASSLFFYLLPPVYQSLSWIADLELLGQFAVLGSFFLFLTSYQDEKRSVLSSFLVSLAILLVAWPGMKLKETARIIPFVLLGFIFLHQNFNFLGWLRKPRPWPLFICALVLLVPVVPWKPSTALPLDTRSHTAIFNFDLIPLFQILVPLGTLVGGVFLFVLLGALLSLKSKGEEPRALPQPPSGPLLFLLIWSLLCLAGFSLQFEVERNPRYLTTLLIPLTLLGFTLYGRILASLGTKAAKVLQASFVIFLVISLQRNLDEVIFLRNFSGGTEIADYLLTRTIYQDRFQDSEVSWEELDNFFRGKAIITREEARAIRIKEWDQTKDGRSIEEVLKPKNLGKLASPWGAVYILSFRDGLYSGDPRAQQIFKGTTANGSLYSRLIGRIKKKSHRKIYLYKYTA